MAAPTETYIDPAVGGGNDFGGAAFVDGAFANATNTLTKVGAFPAVTNIAGDKIYLTDNGSAEVTPGLYTIVTRTSDDAIVLSADIRSGGNDPTDVVCAQHDGTVNLEWATVQHALNFTTRDAVNGDRMNVMAGTDDVLAAALVLTTYGTPTATTPLIFQGYTTAAADGGIGGIDGDATYTMITPATLDYIWFVDMHLHNSGAVDIVFLDNGCSVINCEVNNTTAEGIHLDIALYIMNCHVHNIGTIGIHVSGDDCRVIGNTVEDEANVTTIAIHCDSGNGVTIMDNIIDKGATGDGIVVDSDSGANIINNSIFSASSTGTGIDILSDGQSRYCLLLNNIVEGFIGAGGVGISTAATSFVVLYGMNAAYNNTANYSHGGYELKDLGDNEVLGASAFGNAAGQDFTVGTSVDAEAYPIANYPGLAVRSYIDKGALQREEPDDPPALRVSIVTP